MANYVFSTWLPTTIWQLLGWHISPRYTIRAVEVAIFIFFVQVLPSENYLNTIEIYDSGGCVWYLTPQGSYDYESTSGAKYWLDLLSKHCSSSVQTVSICHEGYLGKRGQLNTSFKRRWFVLTSEQKVHSFCISLLTSLLTLL